MEPPSPESPPESSRHNQKPPCKTKAHPGERPWPFRPAEGPKRALATQGAVIVQQRAQNELWQRTVESSRHIEEDDCRRDPRPFVEGSALVDQMVAELDGFAGKVGNTAGWTCPVASLLRYLA